MSALSIETAVDAVLDEIGPASLTVSERETILERARRAWTATQARLGQLDDAQTQSIANNVVAISLADRALGKLERVVKERKAS